jgi:NAD(P)-dependent dehydrogenase (short-subunit alcohol dehydrogenase family)
MAYAVVSGSASGIGKCTADRLAAQGYEIVGIDLKNAAVEADLSTAEGRRAAIAKAIELSGG